MEGVMDEQIKPVAFVIFTGRKKPDVEWMAREVERGERLYSQQSIDALRAEVDEQCRLHAIGMERELALIARAERAEAEAEALRALCRDMLPVFEAARPLVLNLDRLRDAARKVAE